MVFAEKEDAVSNILAATTNGTSGNQTFGMSTGTLGCSSNAMQELSLIKFMDSNMDRVAADMARGQGESLEGLAAIMAIEAQDKALFFTQTQQNFDRIFPRSDVTRSDVIDALGAVMRERAELAGYAPAV